MSLTKEQITATVDVAIYQASANILRDSLIRALCEVEELKAKVATLEAAKPKEE